MNPINVSGARLALRRGRPMTKKAFTCGLCGKHHLKSRTCAEQKAISDAKKLDEAKTERGRG